MKKEKDNKKIVSREEEIKSFIGASGSNPLLSHLIQDAIDMESRLDKIKQQPFLRIKGKIQERTEAAKEYGSLMANYIATIKAISFLGGKSPDDKETSPLAEYLKTVGQSE